MLREYFEPENLHSLAAVFDEAQAILKKRNVSHPLVLDAVARRVLELASQGMEPWLILAEILPPMTVEDAGLQVGGLANIVVPDLAGPVEEKPLPGGSGRR